MGKRNAPGADEQVRAHLRRLIRSFKAVTDPAAWRKQCAALRRRGLNEVFLRGIPRAWRTAFPRVVWGKAFRPHPAYRVRRLRYEALPGYWIPALLYEPALGKGRVPAVLNPNGHESGGKAVHYKQARCINLARRGMLALSFEFMGMGELNADAEHDNLAWFQLAGVSAAAPMYLAMKRGLDVLLAHARADRRRVAMTGLSGGGWQTIVLSALDPRITLSVPVAGYTGTPGKIDCLRDIGDIEQAPADQAAVVDYQDMTAMLAPRPALLILNERDDCCFSTEHAKPAIFDPVRPVYRAFGAAGRFECYSNRDPGTHNYDADNRSQLYRFLNAHFGLATPVHDLHDPEEYLSEADTFAGLPADQETLYSLAVKCCREACARLRAPKTAAQRRRLRAVLREILRLPAYGEARGSGTGRLQLRAGPFTLPAKFVRPKGFESARLIVGEGEAIPNAATFKSEARLSADLLGLGKLRAHWGLQMLLDCGGERLLGHQVAQVLALARWLARRCGVARVDVDASGWMGSVAALLACALEPRRFRSLRVMRLPYSLRMLVERGVPYESAQSVFCLGLLEAADVPQLKALLEGVRFEQPDRKVRSVTV
ncbi:MAG: acetylxylan esterase [Planctomycetota bacterium]|nr:acetylxylan esterase [Planctomycetota bacterium]